MKTIATLFLALFCSGVHSQSTTFQRTIGGTGQEYGTGIQTFDGGYIFAGSTNSFGAGLLDIYLVRTDSTGDTLWTKTYGGTNNDWAHAVIQTSDSGFVITGTTKSYGAGQFDIFLMKLNSSGTLQWEKTYGGNLDEFAFTVEQTNDHGFIIGGYTTTYGSGFMDCYFIKTDSLGSIQWNKVYGGANNDQVLRVIQNPDGGYTAAGYCYRNASGALDILLMRTDSIGDTLWTKTFGTGGNDYGYDVIATLDGGYILTGVLDQMNSVIIKTDSAGETTWTRSFSGGLYDEAYRIIQKSNGNYVFSGWTNKTALDEDITLTSLDSSGNLLWLKTAGGFGMDQGSSVCSTSDGGFIVTATAKDFGAGDWDLMMCKTDSLGNFGCNQTSNMVSIVPATLNTSSFDLNITTGGSSSNVTMLTGSGGVITDACTVGFNENISSDNSITIYPNPVSSGNVSIQSKQQITRYELYNVNGELLMSGIPNGNNGVSVPEEAGIYFVKIYSGKECFVKKLVKF
ncbi:MAG TPA: T9SS type A sorting domain-containing protein [Bacteroidia bacterium]|jgi:hypothetical protein|nr:T9SS type A sorting domain-containing protein [Bacteroidia bacterium]